MHHARACVNATVRQQILLALGEMQPECWHEQHASNLMRDVFNRETMRAGVARARGSATVEAPNSSSNANNKIGDRSSII